MTETSGMVQITNRLWPFFSAIITIGQNKLWPLFLQNYHWSKQGNQYFCKTTFGQNWVTITFIDHKRVEPGNFRIGRVGRAHNDYYEVTLKDRYFDDGGDNEFTLFSPDAS